MTDPEGQPVSRRWTGRRYAHLLVPVGYLTPAVLGHLDRAVAAADGWAASPEDSVSAPLLRRDWRRTGAGGELTLTVVGWYPLLLTVLCSTADRSSRRALRRLVDAVRSADGRLIGDLELARRVDAAADRGAAAGALHAHAAAARAELAGRRCGRCGDLAAAAATHCPACGRRFDASDDAAHAVTHRRAAARLAEAVAELDRLATDRAMRPAGPSAEAS